MLRHRSVSVVLVRAVQKDDPAHDRPELLPDQSSWAEHLSSQNLQADRYRPPTYDVQDMQASRGKFLGRLAVLILGAVLLSERITGKGAVQQLEISATGVPLWEIEPVLGVVVLALSAAALWPNSRKSRTDRQNKLAFFQRIQNLSGRFACLGLASAITAEVITGKGTLTLLNVETGMDSVSELEAIGAFVVMLLLTEDVVKGKKQ